MDTKLNDDEITERISALARRVSECTDLQVNYGFAKRTEQDAHAFGFQLVDWQTNRVVSTFTVRCSHGGQWWWQ